MKKFITAPAPRMILRLLALDEILKRIRENVGEHRRFCEIGAGLGDASALALDRLNLNEVKLYDAAPKAQQILSDRFSDWSEVEVKGDFEINESFYQLVFCFEVLEHIDEDQVLFNQIHDSISEGGYFLGSVPAYMKKWQAVDELAGHYRRYEIKELKMKLVEAGFTDVTIQTYGFPLINLLYPWRQYYYSKLLKESLGVSKSEATKKSGVSRGYSLKFNKALVYAVVRTFSYFQRLPYFSKYGDGFVFCCRKP